MFFRGKKEEKFDTIEKEEDADILEIIELVAKDTQLKVRDLNKTLVHLVDIIPTIKELKAEIAALKIELKDQQNFNRELIHKLIDKPAAPSASAAYLANKAAEAARANGGGLAAVEKAAKK